LQEIDGQRERAARNGEVFRKAHRGLWSGLFFVPAVSNQA
jgi:hypothetical protein